MTNIGFKYLNNIVRCVRRRADLEYWQDAPRIRLFLYFSNIHSFLSHL